ncbi:MAG: guanylate kinase [Candidatus Omnitrophota bacterium]|nr:MAG: guanylate kinase [Candidatus Omnitrophota bacterium]
MKKNSGLIFVISGPSGSGKTTLLSKLINSPGLKQALKKSISFTTRPRRSKERNGRDYYFITEQQFRDRLRKKKILEWTKYLGYYYATPSGIVDKCIKDGKNIALCLDKKGAFKLKKLYPGTITIFVMPPSLVSLRQRIRGRCNKTSNKEISGRLRLAEKEMMIAKKYDFCIINKDLEQASREATGIISRLITLNNILK